MVLADSHGISRAPCYSVLSFGTGDELGGRGREDISLAAGIGLLLIGALFLLTELRKEHPPNDPRSCRCSR